MKPMSKLAVASIAIPFFTIACLFYGTIGEMTVREISFVFGCLGILLGYAAQHRITSSNGALAGKWFILAGVILDCLLILFALFSTPVSRGDMPEPTKPVAWLLDERPKAPYLG